MLKNKQITAVGEPISAKVHKGRSLRIPERCDSSVSVVLRGKARITAGGKSYPAREGDAIIVIDREAEIEAEGEGVEIISADFMSYLIGEEMLAALIERGPLFSSTKQRASIIDGIEQIQRELKDDGRFAVQAATGRLLILAAEISRSENEYEGSERSSQIAAAISYIAGHYQEKISLSELAAVAGVSPAYLSKRFTREMGMGYADYVSLYRLTRAERMLREEPEKTVTEVAFYCGFNDSNYFSDKFKKHFGIAPLKYKKAVK
jgi:AraC-like DNA-binding protein